jgi:hypothetical protein
MILQKRDVSIIKTCTGISELAEKIIAANVEEYANKLLSNSKN